MRVNVSFPKIGAQRDCQSILGNGCLNSFHYQHWRRTKLECCFLLFSINRTKKMQAFLFSGRRTALCNHHRLFPRRSHEEKRRSTLLWRRNNAKNNQKKGTIRRTQNYTERCLLKWCLKIAQGSKLRMKIFYF